MAKVRKNPASARLSLPKPGDAFLMPLADGRFGFCHVIDRPSHVMGAPAHGVVVVETSSWVGEQAPELNDSRLREVLVQTHHDSGPNTWRVMVRGPAPHSFERIGTIEPNAAGRFLAVWTSWERLATEVLTQWRWDHDREALLREEEEAVVRWHAEQAQTASRRQDGLDRLTLESLKRKRRFSSWKGDRPDKAVAACRRAFGETVDALIELGLKPKKRAVATVIRRCVEQLNALDEKYDGFIETGEREELCHEIDELVYAVGLRGCDGLADRWREW